MSRHRDKGEDKSYSVFMIMVPTRQKAHYSGNTTNSNHEISWCIPFENEGLKANSTFWENVGMEKMGNTYAATRTRC